MANSTNMQPASHLLMIRPVNFGFNAETAVNNAFQKNSEGSVQQNALKEFNDLVALLTTNKVDVTVVEDSLHPATPDSIFPNNWISFHEDGLVYLYPMFAHNRRLERKPAVIDTVQSKFTITEMIDLTGFEEQDIFLEGTGSMVLDREFKIAYASLSPRTNEMVLTEFCKRAGYRPVIFSSADEKGIAIYHTNVMMCVAKTFAVVCLECISTEEEKINLLNSLKQTGKSIVDISLQQLKHFAGNMLQVMNKDGELLLVMSTQAYQSLSVAQVTVLQSHNRILHTSLNTIEMAGGGSARCMMAEIFLLVN